MSRARDLYQRIQEGGIAAVQALIADRVAEELFLDFKKSGDDGGGRTLHANDNRNLSKAISGFGNSAGGVIIWGVECAPAPNGADVAASLHPLHDAQAFRSRLESAVSRLSVPPHDGVEHLTITDPEAPPRGYVVTLVPQSSRAPLRAEAPGLRNYYIRAGSSFEVIPHDALAGLFGRLPLVIVSPQFLFGDSHRPQHQQDQNTRLRVVIALANLGSVLAEKAFVSVWWGDTPGVSVVSLNDSFRVRGSSLPAAQGIAQDGVLIAPDGTDEVLQLVIVLPEPAATEVAIRVTVGARGARPHTSWLRASVPELDDAIQRSKQGAISSATVITVESESDS